MATMIAMECVLGMVGMLSNVNFLDLEIPRSYVAEQRTSGHVSSYEGDEEGTSVVLRIPMHMIFEADALASVGQDDSKNGLLLILSRAEHGDFERANQRIWTEMRSRGARFREAYSEKDASNGLFKVFPSRDTTFMWHVVTRDPFGGAGNGNEAGNVVGVCSEKGTGVTCSINFMIDGNLQVEISSVDYQYLSYLDQLEGGLEGTILAWRRK